MMRLLKVTLIFALLGLSTLGVQAQCPTPGATVIQVCNDAGGSGTIRAFFYDGDVPVSYILYDITGVPVPISEPLGPVLVDDSPVLPPSAVAGVEFTLVPDGDYVIRIACSGGGVINIGGFGINVNAANSLAATPTVDPDCNAATGGANADGSISLSVSGGSAPYDITWPSAVTPIADLNNVAAGNHSFPNLDGGLYTLVITDANNCVFTSDIYVPLSTMPDAGTDQEVCGSSATLAANSPAAGETGTWTGPSGVTFSPNANTPNAVAGNLPAGANVLTWSITDTDGICAGNSANVTITAYEPATVDAGSPQAICSGSTVTLGGSIGGGAASVTWSSSGDGTFSDIASLTPVYTPGAADIAAGSVTLTITTDDPAGPCAAVNDNVVITLEAGSTVEAGAAQTICSNGSATLSGAFGGSATAATWTSSGDGTFNNPAALNAVYTPGPADIAAKTVTLTLTTNDPPGPCLPATDNVVITIDAAATADAGADQVLCSGESATLAGTIGGPAASATWSTAGDGTFDNAALPNAKYTPGTADLAAGTVALTWTTDDPAGPCGPASDGLVITINALATANAGAPQTICSNSAAVLSGSFGGAATSASWTTAGDGTFDDNTSLTATYTPGTADIANGAVVLTLTTNDPAGPCSAGSGNVTITIEPAPEVDAGAPQTICSGGTVNMTGLVSGTATSVVWSTNGDGTFDDPTSLAAVYTPGTADIAAGMVTLSATTNDPAGPCGPATDDVDITISTPAMANAGGDLEICAGETASLAGSFGGAATTATWSTAGDGTFDDASLATAVYTPGPNDITNGAVTLTLTTDDPAGACAAVTDNVVVTIRTPAVVSAGPDQVRCKGDAVALAGSLSGAATSALWATSGDGTFDDATAPDAVYTPGPNDLVNGTVTLTISSDDPAGPCPVSSASMTVTLEAPATADAGPDAVICSNGQVTLSGSFTGATTATWTTAGDGTFSDPTALTATYTPGNSDAINGTVILTLSTDDPAGPCGPVSDQVIITIQPVATADAGPPETVCADTPITLAGVLGGSATGATWSTAGDGTFDDATRLDATYNPGTGDAAAGNVTLTLTTSDPAGPCLAASDNVLITLESLPLASAGSDQSLCPGATATLASASFGGSATTAAWSLITQPAGGDGVLSDESQTASPASVTFTATVAGSYTLRLTTNDPAGGCGPAYDEVVITVSATATVNAGADQTICEGESATLSAVFTVAGSVTWSSSGDGSFNDASSANAVYTPGPVDISNGAVNLTVTTGGPCAPVNDVTTLTINPAPSVDAGAPQTICSDASAVLNAVISGGATGLIWTTSGDGTFSDNTDVNAAYTPGAGDAANGTVTLTASSTGACAPVLDNVIITVNEAAIVDAGSPQTICAGSDVVLAATVAGSATSLTWTSSGDGTFSDAADPAAVYTPGPNDASNGTVTLTATSDNPAGPCPAASDAVIITFMTIAGDQTTAGNETWTGYVYDDSGDATPIPGKIDFATQKYRGYLESADMGTMSPASTYDEDTDVFDVNPGLASLQGSNVCGNIQDHFSVRYKMNKTFSAGVYRFHVGADDGVRLLIDGADVLPSSAFGLHAYATYTSDPVCLSAGVHSFEIQYFDNTAQSRLTFSYEALPGPDVTSPAALCINSAAPSLSATSADAAVTDFRWYKNGVLVFTGSSYTPAASELDMTTAGTTAFEVTAVYSCGESTAVPVSVEVLNMASLTIGPETICESAGTVDLRTLVNASPSGGTFTFTGHANISGYDFDPSGLAGTTVSIAVDYAAGSCASAQGTLELSITNTASITAPGTAIAVCESAPAIDLTTLVSAAPTGGTFSFSGPQVTGNTFNPSGLAGIQTITVNYTVGCTAPSATFDIDVISVASLTATNITACENGPLVNLASLVSATPSGGTFAFSGSGVSGNSFNPAGQSGTVAINVTYDVNGCTDNGIIQVSILDAANSQCTGGNCADVVIVPLPEPATCTNSDGRVVMSIDPFTPVVNNTGVKITINGISSLNVPVTRTNFNDNVFENLPVGQYDYTIEYGDPSCIKTGEFSIDRSGTVGVPEASNVVSPSCFGTATGSLTLDVPGETGNVLEWSLDGGLTDPFKPFTAGSQITGIPAGPAPSFQQVISVRKNISDLCYSSVTVTVPEAVQDITASFSITPASCNGNDGAITGIAAGGGKGAPYTFSIDGGQSFQSADSFNGLVGGTYTLRVRDVAGCEKDFPATVTFPGYVSTQISKTNASCENNGSSGSITVSITDMGSFEVALSKDQFAADPSEYRAYNNPGVTFGGLTRGEYYVYIRPNGGGCPTRSAPINIFGVYPVSFALEPVCQGTEISLALTNVTGETGAAPLRIEVTRKLSAEAPVIIEMPVPVNGEIYLGNDQHAFLRTPGEYSIRMLQEQSEAGCTLSSEVTDMVVSRPMAAQVGPAGSSYPDIPTGQLQLTGFSGGTHPYDVRIELDSAASFALPEHATAFEEPWLNNNQQYEIDYDNVPPGRYQVQVRDSQGCVLELVARVPLDESLFIPNVFTPNGDGSNDVFYIRNLPAGSSASKLVISNRWGKEVYMSGNYQNDWDGDGAADGLYYYRLQVEGNDTVTGWVEIIRGPQP